MQTRHGCAAFMLLHGLAVWLCAEPRRSSLECCAHPSSNVEVFEGVVFEREVLQAEEAAGLSICDRSKEDGRCQASHRQLRNCIRPPNLDTPVAQLNRAQRKPLDSVTNASSLCMSHHEDAVT